jgi:hypothetical protein
MTQETLTTFSNYMKTKYGKVSANVYNTATPVLMKVKREHNFVGEDERAPVPTGYEGGVGSGSLPVAGKSNAEKYTITTKKVYGRTEIQRQLMKQASRKEGAFVKALGHKMGKAVESYTRNTSRILFNDASGSLAIGSASAANVTGAGTTGDPYLVELKMQNSTTSSIAANKRASLEKRDLINVNSETTNLEITAVAVASDKDVTLTLVGTSARLATLAASGPFAAADTLYMQGSKDADPEGLKGVCDATSGTKYGISIGDRWQSFQKAVTQSISEDLALEMVLGVHEQCGKSIDLIVTSYKQWRKFSNQLEDKKEVKISPKYGSEKLKAKVGYNAICMKSPFNDDIPIVIDRFCEDDRMYFLNTSQIVLKHAPDHGWFDDDGTIFMRVQDDDAYEARYGGYKEFFIIPSFHGVLTGLT